MKMTTTLFDTPPEVLEASVPPFLQINELLRLRRVCTFTKTISDDYLRRHPRSKTQVCIYLSSEGEAADDHVYQPNQPCSKSTFHHHDSPSTIRIPSKIFKLDHSTGQVFGSHLVGEFLERYGNQVEDLEMSTMTVPMDQKEIIFYEKLPRLKRLTVRFYDHEISDEVVAFKFPETFKRLKELRVPAPKPGNTVGCNHYWALIEFCENVEVCGFTSIYGESRDHFKVLNEILARNCTIKLKFYDMTLDHIFTMWDSIDDICHMCVKFGIKLLNINGDLLSSFGKVKLEKVANQVLSIRNLWSTYEPYDFHNVPLPNVKNIELFVPKASINTKTGRMPDDAQISEMQRILSIKMFPGLKKLTLTLSYNRGFCSSSRVLAEMWSIFPHLEELEVRHSAGLYDVAFMGINGERPFLALKSLKRLRLEYYTFGELGPTDVTFSEVFRHMRLREFSLASGSPIKSITAGGIRALLTGQFRESIEKFPFHGWSLAGVNTDEFLQISREFPNNQKL